MKNKNKKSQKTEWYRLDEERIFERLDSSLAGLTNEQAIERIEKYGKNTLPVKKPPSIPKILLDQLLNPLIYILITAGIVSFAIGDKKDAFFIFIVILINTAIGAYQEWKAERSSEALRNLLKICVTVRRNDVKRRMNADCLVPGDVVYLESGDKVPADIRIIKQSNLMSDESLLTGESTGVVKNNSIIEREIPLSERENMLYAGSIVLTGRCTGIIAETGLRTEIGKIAEQVTSQEKTKPPLIRRMEKFSTQISIIVLFSCAIIALIQFYRGESIFEIFFLVVALAVSSIPEGLPAALTVVLSVGMSRMSKRNVIVRKLPAVEGLGSCTMIASDKTGTLTVNKQTVKLIYLPDGSKFCVTGEGYSGEGEIFPIRDKYNSSDINNLIRCAVICNEASLTQKDGKWVHSGDAVDVALLAAAYKYGLNPMKINKNTETIKEIPFESERKFSARFYHTDDKVNIVVKGAFEVITDFCSKMRVKNTEIEINHSRLKRQLDSLAATGHRVIAFAEGEMERKTGIEYYEEDLKNLTFLGLTGLIDPLRPEAVQAVDTCKKAGIKVIMITGDHPATSLTIGKNLGIVKSGRDVVEGVQLSEIDETSKEFTDLVNRASVFARVTPLQKFHIVDALIRSGNFIAVTGDGVNDAPALKKAHISVAMGSGTDVAKDVSSMIVVDDNFASVVAGIEEGRYAYDNIRKVIYLLVATGAAEIVLFILAIGFALPAPLTAVQLLWLNLVTNGIQGIALAFEKGEKETMKKQPRKPDEGIFNRLMVQEIALSGASMGIIAFILWFLLVTNGASEFYARNIILLLMVLFENIHVFNCRSEYKSAFRVPFKNNILLVSGVLIAQSVHILSMNIPVMQEILGIQPVEVKQWFYLLLISGLILVIMEFFKKIKAASHSKSL